MRLSEGPWLLGGVTGSSRRGEGDRRAEAPALPHTRIYIPGSRTAGQ